MEAVTRRLLAWYDAHGRMLPWRRTRNPYRIFISELMLQQTQVDRVLPIFRAWLRRFPSWRSLANASTRDLIHAWAGLGYNRRALYAREAARDVIKRDVPKGVEAWRRLKGVGPYMASALAEFVDHQRAIVIDTNVRRVVGRLAGGIPDPTPNDDPRIGRALERITPIRRRHWDVPQAFMDLANAVCTPRTPDCAQCPLRADCQARKKFGDGLINMNRGKRKMTSKTERIHEGKSSPDRIYRGRILALIRTRGKRTISQIGHAVDENYDPISDLEWIRAMCTRLVKDGLLVQSTGDILSLPHS